MLPVRDAFIYHLDECRNPLAGLNSIIRMCTAPSARRDAERRHITLTYIVHNYIVVDIFALGRKTILIRMENNSYPSMVKNDNHPFRAEQQHHPHTHVLIFSHTHTTNTHNSISRNSRSRTQETLDFLGCVKWGRHGTHTLHYIHYYYYLWLHKFTGTHHLGT